MSIEASKLYDWAKDALVESWKQTTGRMTVKVYFPKKFNVTT